MRTSLTLEATRSITAAWSLRLLQVVLQPSFRHARHWTSSRLRRVPLLLVESTTTFVEFPQVLIALLRLVSVLVEAGVKITSYGESLLDITGEL